MSIRRDDLASDQRPAPAARNRLHRPGTAAGSRLPASHRASGRCEQTTSHPTQYPPLHELGHALEARREGIPTRGVTLWMLGGVAESGAPFATPGVEARVALAGPAVSAALGAALVGAGQVAGLPTAAAAVLEWLGWTNLLLPAFNLLPALPLDGGRVLRAALWRLRGSHVKATRNATRVSQAVSVGLIAIGVLGAFDGGGFGGQASCSRTRPSHHRWRPMQRCCRWSRRSRQIRSTAPPCCVPGVWSGFSR